MKNFRTLYEASKKLVSTKIFENPKKFDILYGVTDGKGKWGLTNDGSVFWSDKKEVLEMEIDGKPKSKNPEYDIMEFNKKLGIYDSNMQIIVGYKNMKQLVNDLEEDLAEEEIELLNWDA